jgi:thiamine biosynthesis lipoprotein
MEKLEFRAMGSGMLAALEADGEQAREALSMVPDWFEVWEQHLSRFRPDSELSALNRGAGRWLEVSPVMWDVLMAADRIERRSAGLVTPALQGVLEAYGYDRSFEMVAILDAGFNMKALPPHELGRMQMELDIGQHRVRFPEGTQLDFGGIAKGWAADQAVQRLKPYGSALVDAGGDVATSAPSGEEAAWPVGIMDPLAPEGMIGLLALQGEAAATSGRDVHHWMQGGHERHHIIDPRSGEPAANHVLAVTVIAPSAVEAEMAAKCVLILGEVEGKIWLEARPEYAGLIVLEDGSHLASRTLGSYLWSE